MPRTIAFILGCLMASTGYASDEEPVCVKYKKEYGWSSSYAVNAKIMSGSDLSSATGNYTRFRSFVTYAVIFWDKNQTTILELPPTSLGSVPMFTTNVKDQEDREWQISQSSGFCF